MIVKLPEGNQPDNKKRDGTVKKIILTNDHEVYTDRGIVRVDELKVTDTLYAARPSITPDGMSALIGMYLGDGHLSKKGYFVLAHGEHQKSYLEHIARKFGNRPVWRNEVTLKWTQQATGKLINRTYPVYRTRIQIKRLWKNFPADAKKRNHRVAFGQFESDRAGLHVYG